MMKNVKQNHSKSLKNATWFCSPLAVLHAKKPCWSRLIQFDARNARAYFRDLPSKEGFSPPVAPARLPYLQSIRIDSLSTNCKSLRQCQDGCNNSSRHHKETQGNLSAILPVLPLGWIAYASNASHVHAATSPGREGLANSWSCQRWCIWTDRRIGVSVKKITNCTWSPCLFAVSPIFYLRK